MTTQQIPERHAFVAAGQLETFVQLPFRERLDPINALDGTHGQVLHVHTIQRVATVHTAAVLVARLVVLQATTAIGITTGCAATVVFFLHHLLVPENSTNTLPHPVTVQRTGHAIPHPRCHALPSVRS
jgi:hypothetical protein